MALTVTLQSHAKTGRADWGRANLPHVAQPMHSIMNSAAFSRLWPERVITASPMHAYLSVHSKVQRQCTASALLLTPCSAAPLSPLCSILLSHRQLTGRPALHLLPCRGTSVLGSCLSDAARLPSQIPWGQPAVHTATYGTCPSHITM